MSYFTKLRVNRVKDISRKYLSTGKSRTTTANILRGIRKQNKLGVK